MSVKVVLVSILVVSSVTMIKGQPPNSASFEACTAELKITDPSKFTCMIGCVGKKDGWINGDGTLDVDKKVAVVTQMGMPASDIPKLKAAADACKNEGKGLSDFCQLGEKLFNCLTQNGAPRPPMPPPPFN